MRGTGQTDRQDGQRETETHNDVGTYFILAGDFIKIGVSENPKERRQDLQTGSPHRLRLLGVLDGNLEASMHTLFHQFRFRGEWFYAVPSILCFIEAAGGHGRRHHDADYDTPMEIPPTPHVTKIREVLGSPYGSEGLPEPELHRLTGVPVDQLKEALIELSRYGEVYSPRPGIWRAVS